MHCVAFSLSSGTTGGQFPEASGQPSTLSARNCSHRFLCWRQLSWMIHPPPGPCAEDHLMTSKAQGVVGRAVDIWIETGRCHWLIRECIISHSRSAVGYPTPSSPEEGTPLIYHGLGSVPTYTPAPSSGEPGVHASTMPLPAAFA